MSVTRTMIVDGLPVVRWALSELLVRNGHEIVALADNGRAALDEAQQLHPELMVLELLLSELSGLEVVRRVRARNATTRILVYTSQSAEHFARLCHQAGADGFVSKHDDLTILEEAVSAVLHGRHYFPSDGVVRGNAEAGDELSVLSGRELSVLQMLAEGMTNHDIGQQLSISDKTVSTYKSRIQEKLHVRSRVELAEIARRNGLGLSRVSTTLHVASQVAPESEQFEVLKPLVEGAPAPMMVRDRDGRLLMCNDAFLCAYRAHFSRVEGTRISEAPWFSPQTGGMVQQRYRELLKEGKPYSTEAVLDVNGERRLFYLWAIPHRDAAGAVIGLVGGWLDMTDRQQMLAALRNDKEAAEMSSREKSLFLGAVSQELALCAGLEPGMGSRLWQALADLQEVSRLESGQIANAPVQIDLRTLLGQAIESLPRTGGWTDREIRADAGLDIATVWVDPALFTKLVGALVRLAASEDRGPLRLMLTSQLQPDALVVVRLSVTVNGGDSAVSPIVSQLCTRLLERMDGQLSSTEEASGIRGWTAEWRLAAGAGEVAVGQEG